MQDIFKKIIFREINDIKDEDEIGEVIFTDNAISTTVLDYCLNKKINHFVQKSNLHHQKEIFVSENCTQNQDLFFNFPLSVINGEQNPSAETEKSIKKISFIINDVQDKNSLILEIEQFVRQFSKSTTLLNDILNTTDELFTNAVYNAPYVNFDNEKSGINRNFEDAVVDPQKKPYFFAGNDEERIILGCLDHYGTLNVEKLLLRIKKCYEANLSEMINYGTGGAGIGAYLIFESVCSLYLNVKKGHSTLICCSFPYKISSTQRSQLPKNLHIFKTN